MEKNIVIETIKHKEDGFTLSQIENHVKNQDSLETDLNSTYFACIDGRSKEKIVGTFGGDAGEWVAILRAIELTIKIEFTYNEQYRLFLDYLAKRTYFYHHTDEKSLGYMEKKLLCKINLDTIAGDPELLAKFYDLSSQTEYIGCGHLQLQAAQPEKYLSRPQLIKDFIKIFLFEYLEHKNPKLIYTILEGYHEEKAVKIIHSPMIISSDLIKHESHEHLDDIDEHKVERQNLYSLCDIKDDDKSIIPLFTPHCEDQVFVYHQTAAEKLRYQMIKLILLLFKRRYSNTFAIKKNKLTKKVKEVVDIQQKSTIEILALQLPIFKITID